MDAYIKGEYIILNPCPSRPTSLIAKYNNSRQLPSRNLVAIKVMEIDSTDYKINRDMKDESIKDFIHEIKVMNQAKEAGAKNINMLIEAISIHSQLWVVCEYCPGGSVKTLVSGLSFQ